MEVELYSIQSRFLQPLKYAYKCIDNIGRQF
jgi:hypothetical protein